MSEINELSAIDAIASGDQLVVYDTSNGDARKASVSTIQAYMQSSLTFSDGITYTTQYSAPSATGFSVAITDGSANIHLILTPVAGYAAGTIVLPAVANVVDKQEVLVNCTQAVTTLTVDGNGATVTGEPAAFVANDFFRLKYDAVLLTWYRIG
jgi:hypothetical protein